MFIIPGLIAAAGWCIAAIVFEAGYRRLRTHASLGIGKGKACQAWWLVLTLLTVSSGSPNFLFNLPMLCAIGLSHIDLAAHNDNVITLAEIIGNTPAALQQGFKRIRPFLR